MSMDYRLWRGGCPPTLSEHLDIIGVVPPVRLYLGRNSQALHA
jgi:hypothetical protein